MTTVVFTGTRDGMTLQQLRKVQQRLCELLLRSSIENKRPTFIFGDAIGSDEQAFEMASELGFWTIAHPSDIEHQRAYCSADEIRAPRPPLERNAVMVNTPGVDRVLAAPLQWVMIKRSGTWATVRYAQDLYIPVYVIKPDGTEEYII